MYRGSHANILLIFAQTRCKFVKFWDDSNDNDNDNDDNNKDDEDDSDKRFSYFYYFANDSFQIFLKIYIINRRANI